MKADGTKIAERWAAEYDDAVKGLDSDTHWLDSFVVQLIEELSAAEERERVLRDALGKQNRFLFCDEDADEYPTEGCECEACTIQRLVDAALATPAPEPAQKEHV